MLAEFFSCVGAGIIAKNSRQQFDERRTAVTELGLSTRIRLCPTSWSSSGWPRKPLIVRTRINVSWHAARSAAQLPLSRLGLNCFRERAGTALALWPNI